MLGINGGDGVSMSTAVLGQCISELTSMQVAIIDLNVSNPYGDMIRYFGYLNEEKWEFTATNGLNPLTGRFTEVKEKTVAGWARFPWGDKNDELITAMRHNRKLAEAYMVKISDSLFLLPPLKSLAGEKLINPEVVLNTLDIIRRHFDVILIDAGNRLTDYTAACVESADETIIFCQAGLIPLDNLYEFTMAVEKELPPSAIVSVVVNKAQQDAVSTLRKNLPLLTNNYPVLSIIPHDPETHKNAINSAVIPNIHDSTPYIRELEKVLYHIFPRELFKRNRESRGGGLLSFFRRN
jgi:MinD-like ATPase involved in chromosome partitioning or flagellar assembly